MMCLSRKNAEAISIDLRKAFDCIKHDILLPKLRFYSVVGPHIKIFSSYLKNHTQVVTIESKHSTEADVQLGVPQVSVQSLILSWS